MERVRVSPQRSSAGQERLRQQRPHTVYNQFGGAGGGRIIRDKLFVFGDYQGSRDINGASNLPTIPTLPFRQGDLSASTTAIYDPATGNADGTGRAPVFRQADPAQPDQPYRAEDPRFLPAPPVPGS